MKKNVKPSCNPKTAVAYARYSSAGQRDVSIEQQLKDIRAYAKREGYTIVHEYADHAKSGFKNPSARIAFNTMLKEAENGSFDTVIVWKVDRFGRDREAAAISKGALRKLGVSVVYAMESIPAGAAGVITEGMLEAIAEWYSRNLSENITRGMSDNASKCLYNGTRVLGYHRGEDGKYAITKDEASVVRSIFERYCDGYSAATIAGELNAFGLKTPRNTPFSAQTVLRILSNERYLGTYIWGSVRVPGGMPAIINPDEWEKAQIMKEKSARHIEDSPVDFLLTGKAFCGLCGEGMVGDSGTSKSGERHYYYTCHGRKAKKGCKKISVRKEQLESLVVDLIINRVLTGEVTEKIANAVVAAELEQVKSSPLAAMEAELIAVNKKIDNINDAIAEGIWNSSTSVKLKSLEDTAESLKISIEEMKFSQSQLITKERVLFFLEQMAAYDPADPVRRRQLIDTFVNAVYVFDDHLHIAINCVEGNTRIPLTDVVSNAPPCSSNDADAPPVVVYPNTRIAIYTIAV